jgi:exopolysaccharide production protein ExoQ
VLEPVTASPLEGSTRRDGPLLVLTYLVVLLCLRGLFPLLLSDGDYQALEANLVWKTGVATLQVLCAAAIARHWGLIARTLMLRALPLHLTILLPAISAVWSEDPLMTLRSGIGVIITGLFMIVVCLRLGHRAIICICLHLTLILGALSVAFALLSPGLGTMESDGISGWRGCFMHKNPMGSRMLIGFIAALASMVMAESARERRLMILAAVFFAGLIVMSQSRTPFIGMLLVGGVVFLLNPSRIVPLRLPHRAALIAIGCVGLTMVALSRSDDLGAYLTDNRTLTGRTDLWNDLLVIIERRPLLGYGYLSFWSSESLRYQAFGASGWQTGKAHSAVLDHMLDLGLLGVVVLVALGLAICLRIPRLLAASSGAIPVIRPGLLVFYVGLLITLLPLGFAEVRFVLQNDIHFALCVAASTFFLMPAQTARLHGDAPTMPTRDQARDQ